VQSVRSRAWVPVSWADNSKCPTPTRAETVSRHNEVMTTHTGSCKHRRTMTTSLHRTALSIRCQRRHILVHGGDILQPDFHFRLPSVDGKIHRAEWSWVLRRAFNADPVGDTKLTQRDRRMPYCDGWSAPVNRARPPPPPFYVRCRSDCIAASRTKCHDRF